MADVEPLTAIMGYASVMRHIGKGALTPEEVAERVARAMQSWNEVGMGWWTIRLADDGPLIGQICLKPTSELSEVEVGYALTPSTWGKGYAQEALEEVVRYGRERLRLSRIVTTVRPENEHSVALLLRCRFEFESAIWLRNKTLHLYVRDPGRISKTETPPSHEDG